MKTTMWIPVLALGFVTALGGCASTSTGSAANTCSVQGCVERSGPIALGGDDTVFEVVQQAQPIEGRSDLSRVQLQRKTPDGELSWQIDVARMLETGDSTYNVHVQPGDVVTVPSR